jgi:uncharacterized protein
MSQTGIVIMSSESNIFTLPLFPLHSVLFPLSPLQLHVFEERYRVMINSCIERGEPFGVVLIREGSEVGAPAHPFDVGCMAHIRAVRRLEDERLYLLAVGGNRFRLLDYVEAELPYLIGQVEMLQDDPLSPTVTLEEHNELSALFLRYLALRLGSEDLAASNVTLPDDPALLTLIVAGASDWPLPIKQSLLESTAPTARLAEVLPRLRGDLEEMEAQRVREAAQPEQEGESPAIVLRVHSVSTDKETVERYRHQGRN